MVTIDALGANLHMNNNKATHLRYTHSMARMHGVAWGRTTIIA